MYRAQAEWPLYHDNGYMVMGKGRPYRWIRIGYAGLVLLSVATAVVLIVVAIPNFETTEYPPQPYWEDAMAIYSFLFVPVVIWCVSHHLCFGDYYILEKGYRYKAYAKQKSLFGINLNFFGGIFYDTTPLLQGGKPRTLSCVVAGPHIALQPAFLPNGETPTVTVKGSRFTTFYGKKPTSGSTLQSLPQLPLLAIRV